MHTHYETLQVNRGASPSVIRAAYRILAQQHHPDVNHSADAEQLMKRINEAWSVLSDPELRAGYDRQVAIEELLGKRFDAPKCDQSGNTTPSTPGGGNAEPATAPSPISPDSGGSKAILFWFGLASAVALVIAIATGSKKEEATPPAAPSGTWTQSTSSLGPSQDEVTGILDATRTALTTAHNTKAPPEPVFPDTASRLTYHRWADEMSQRLKPKLPETRMHKEFLQTVWYESKRAGLDTALVLATIEVGSNFRKYAISQTGARGYMQVSPDWVRTIGDGDPNILFHMQANLRFGCVILRHYLDRENGDLFNALESYNGNRGERSFANSVLAAKQYWSFDPQVKEP